MRKAVYHGQFRLSRRKANIFSLKIPHLIRTPVNTDNIHCSVSAYTFLCRIHSYNVNSALRRPANCPALFPWSFRILIVLLSSSLAPGDEKDGTPESELANCLFSSTQSCTNTSQSFLFCFFFFFTARKKVIVPLGEETEVIKKVSQKVGSWWKKLARELELKDRKIKNISMEEIDDEECCYVTLRAWCQQKGRDATVRKLMIALTRIGKAEVNNDIMECLDLLNPVSV